MHVPDGFLSLPAAVATGVVAASAIGVAIPIARREHADNGVPVIGIVAALIFAAQMVNFPVSAGTTGHLLGGVLAAVLVGPATGLLCITAVLLVQAVVFGDGGLAALGTNVTLLGVGTIAVGWTVFRTMLAVLPRRRAILPISAATGALVSVPAAAVIFAFLFAVGGTVSVPISELLPAMLGWHSLIGLGEAVITGLVVSAWLAVRPDLVHGAWLGRSARTVPVDAVVVA